MALHHPRNCRSWIKSERLPEFDQLHDRDSFLSCLNLTNGPLRPPEPPAKFSLTDSCPASPLDQQLPQFFMQR
jgi:hypothetical protein